MRGVAYRSVCLRMRIRFSGNMGVSSFNNIEEQPWLSELRYRLEWVHINIKTSWHLSISNNYWIQPNNYSQPMHNTIIIVVHNLHYCDIIHTCIIYIYIYIGPTSTIYSRTRTIVDTNISCFISFSFKCCGFLYLLCVFIFKGADTLSIKKLLHVSAIIVNKCGNGRHI